MEKKHSGFTIVELLIAVVVVGIIASAGVYGYKSFAASTGLKANAKQLAGDLWMARQRSIAGSAPVSIVFEMDENRYRVWMDDGAGGKRGNGKINGGAGEEIILVRELGDNYFIYDVNLDSANVVTYYPTGMLKRGTTGGYVSMADCDNATRTVSILPSGVARVD